MHILFRAFIYFILAIMCLGVCLVFLKKLKCTKKCEECENELKENEKICSKCGNPIKDTEKQKPLYFVIVGVFGVTTLFFVVKTLGVICYIFSK